MKKLMPVLMGLAALLIMIASAAADSTVVKGYVSDSMCGVKGATEKHAQCMTKCLNKGAKAVIVTDGDQKVLNVDNPDAVKGHEGHHVSVTGTVTGDTIHITNVAML